MASGTEITDLARHRVQRHFIDHRALAPGQAIEYAPSGPVERQAFERLFASGVIRQAHPAHYWFDLDRMGRAPARANVKAKIAAVLAVAIALAAIWLARM